MLDSACLDFCSYFQYINTLPDAVVYSIIDTRSNTVYINYTTKFKSKFGEIAERLALLPGSKFEFWSSVEDSVYKLIIAERYKKKFEAGGFTVPQQSFVNFSVHTRFAAGGESIFVYIQSDRGHKQIVGIFKSVKECDEFRAQYYSSEWDGTPVYCINKQTRDYWVKRGGLIESNNERSE